MEITERGQKVREEGGVCLWLCKGYQLLYFNLPCTYINGAPNENNIIITTSVLFYRGSRTRRHVIRTYSSDIHSSVCQCKCCEWRWELAGCSAPSQRDMKGSVWEAGGRARIHTSRPCGPDSRSLITASPARPSWDTPWTLHRTDGGLLNMQQSQAFPLLTAAACVDNVIPVAPEASYQAKNGYQQLAGKSSVSWAASAFCYSVCAEWYISVGEVHCV